MKLKWPQLLILVVAIILLASASYFFTRPKTFSPETDPTKKLAELLEFSGDSTTCTFSSPQGSGTIHKINGSLRGNFTGSDGASGSMIRDTQYTYIWSPDAPEGIKIANESYSITKLQNDLENNTISLNTVVDYECGDLENKDKNLFIIPLDKKFIDYSMQVKEMNSPDDTNAACAACDSLEGNEQIVCREELCN